MEIRFDKIDTDKDYITVFNGEKDVVIKKEEFLTYIQKKQGIPISKWVKDLNTLKVIGLKEHNVAFSPSSQDIVVNSKYETVKNIPWENLSSLNFDSTKEYKLHLNKSCESHINDYAMGSDMAFFLKSNPSITEIVVDDDITTIGYKGFIGAPVRNIIIGKGITSIESHAFASTQIEEMIIPDNVISLGQSLFYDTEKLYKVVLNDSLESVEPNVFEGARGLKTVIFGKNIKTLCNRSFSRTGLESIILPSTIETIEESAFQESSFMKKIVISEGTKVIKSYAFNCMSKLETVDFPSSLTSIGESLFWGCSTTLQINYKGTKENFLKISNNKHISDGCTIHCTDGDIIEKAPVV